MDSDNHQDTGPSVSPRIVVVDDHLIVLDGLRRLIDAEPGWQVVATCKTAAEALEVVSTRPVDLVVADLRMPEIDGLDLIRRLHGDRPELACVLLTADISDQELAEAMRIGVRGIVLKEQAPSALVECIRAVMAGRTSVVDQGLTAEIDRIRERDIERRAVMQKLTPRELEISRLAAAGLRSREIALRLGIAPGTVKLHLHSVYSKLNITTRVELANISQRLQLGSN
ncbi:MULTISPECIES: response regulator transcription factor [Sinorhizobium]|uniref:Two-component system response regulator n=1 Tax=Sinorhizobium americanum TaxID=194963 RepID=A0A2S3YRY0_9HYPH|nr:two-component system response regulator [Sinorhizobium sp. FG01]PDT52894.1 two-component system response regulator [Sinorhizobium sp. NG07B]POH29066.1 two-component system response regulator [Sinorhizobium americanum]POH34353.1 two-component system response regulator [Sinorhizobium americanum]